MCTLKILWKHLLIITSNSCNSYQFLLYLPAKTLLRPDGVSYIKDRFLNQLIIVHFLVLMKLKRSIKVSSWQCKRAFNIAETDQAFFAQNTKNSCHIFYYFTIVKGL